MKKQSSNDRIQSCTHDNSQLTIMDKQRDSNGMDMMIPHQSPKVSLQTSLYEVEKKDSLKQIIKSESSEKEKDNLPSSPLRKMMGSLGKGIGNIGNGIGRIGKGIGSGIGSLGKGIGSGLGSIGKGIGNGIGKGIGKVGKLSHTLKLNQLGKGLGIVSRGLGLNMLGKGLGAISKRGLRGLGDLSRGLGLDMLGKGLGELGKSGLGQLGKWKDLGKGLDLRELLKKMAGVNAAVLTEKEKKIQFVKGHVKRSDTIAAILALLCLVLSYYENNDFYYPVINDEGQVIKPGNKSTPWGNAIRGVVILISIAMMVCVCLHYHFKLKILKIKRLMLEEDNLYTAGLLPKFFLELLVCSICCPPYFDYTFQGEVLSGSYTYSYDAIIGVIIIFKSYLVLRTYQHYSNWNNEKALKICKMNKCQASVSFALKAELKRRPYIMLAILMFVTIIYLGMAMRTFEMSYTAPNDENNFDFSFFANDMWLIVITMTTVGFGEGYPATHMGRFIGVIACLIGLLLVSLMVVSLTSSSEFTEEELKAYNILKRFYAHHNAQDKAANVIKTLFRLRSTLQIKDSSTYTLRFVWLAKLKKHMHIFLNDYKVANSQLLPVDEILKNFQEKIELDFQDMKQELKKLPDFDEKCTDIKIHQTKFSDNLEEIIKMQTMLGEYFISLNNKMN